MGVLMCVFPAVGAVGLPMHTGDIQCLLGFLPSLLNKQLSGSEAALEPQTGSAYYSLS